MSKLFTQILATTAIVSTLSVSAFAGSPMLKRVDSNNDGLIQLSEFKAQADQKFAKMDADGNGLVTKEERQALKKQKRETRALKKFAKADSNSDGSLSEEEFMAARAARAERMKQKRDVNGDGQLNQDDRDARKKMRKKMRKKRKAYKEKHAAKRIKVDANDDGVVDIAEHQAAVLARFERLDKNADRVLSADEQKAIKRKRSKRHGKKHHGMRQ